MRGRERASRVEATAREKTLQGRSSEVSKEVKAQVMGGLVRTLAFMQRKMGNHWKVLSRGMI